MTSEIVAAHQPMLQLIELSEECLIHIFGFLDLRGLGNVAAVCKCFERIHAEGSLWIGLLPPLKKFQGNPLEPKKIAEKFLIPLGDKGTRNQCVLDLYHKEITLIKPSDNAASACLLSIKHPKIPNSSFVVYIANQQVPGAVIKSQLGVVCVVDDVRQPNDDPTIRDESTSRIVDHLRWFQDNPSKKYQEYKLIPDQDKPADELHLNLRRASRRLRDVPPIAYSESDED